MCLHINAAYLGDNKNGATLKTSKDIIPKRLRIKLSASQNDIFSHL